MYVGLNNESVTFMEWSRLFAEHGLVSVIEEKSADLWARLTYSGIKESTYVTEVYRDERDYFVMELCYRHDNTFIKSVREHQRILRGLGF